MKNAILRVRELNTDQLQAYKRISLGDAFHMTNHEDCDSDITGDEDIINSLKETIGKLVDEEHNKLRKAYIQNMLLNQKR